MWELVCDTLAEWGRFYVAWGAKTVENLGPASYGYALIAVAAFGWIFMKGKDAYSG